jgi:hypothetical protein
MNNSTPFLYRSSVRVWLWRILVILCIATIVPEISMHRHSHFAPTGLHSIDGVFAFYGLLGFIGCILVLIVSKVIERVLSLRLEYYDHDY